MPNSWRLEFIARHFSDLQTIRFAPVPMAMFLAPAAHRMPHVSRSVAWGALFAFSLLGGILSVEYRCHQTALRISEGIP
jgi:hypothetical protein